MRRFGWQWFVLSSVLVASLAAETRPQYGGTLRVSTRATLASLDPAENSELDSFARRAITKLIFDTLVTTESEGVQPALAVSWHASANNQHWQFLLRRGLKFQDGTSLTPEAVAASLRFANPSWTVSSDSESVVIQRDSPAPTLLDELTLPRNAIAKRDGSNVVGTGPFHVSEWQPGRKLTLAAEETCWRGRPYLDRIEIEMGKSYRDQITALDLGKTDLVELPAEQIHRASLEGRTLMTSSPVELVTLIFTREANSPDEKSLREALALSIERSSIRSVLLQGTGLPAGGILPNWMSGYAFVFSTGADLTRARHDREQVHNVPTWTLRYDAGDPMARLLAERIALNAKDAGLFLQPTTSASGDLRLARIPLATDPWIALDQVAAVTGISAPKGKTNSVEDLYVAEQSSLAAQQIIPLFHLPVSYAASSMLKGWQVRSDGSWNLENAWLGSSQP